METLALPLMSHVNLLNRDNKGTHLGRFKEGLNISEPYLVYCEGWTTRLRLWLSSRREGNWKGKAYKLSHREITYLSASTQRKMKPLAVHCFCLECTG